MQPGDNFSIDLPCLTTACQLVWTEWSCYSWNRLKEKYKSEVIIGFKPKQLIYSVSVARFWYKLLPLVNGVVVRECSSGNLCIAVSMSILRNVGSMGWYNPSFTEASMLLRCPKDGYIAVWVVVDIARPQNAQRERNARESCRVTKDWGSQIWKISAFCFQTTRRAGVWLYALDKPSDLSLMVCGFWPINDAHGYCEVILLCDV